MEQGNGMLLSQRGLELEIDKFFKERECSLRPLMGKACQVLKRLKNYLLLLDIEAALSENTLRSPKTSLDKKLAWHTFVKSASTYEMVQATIVVKEMINKELLRFVMAPYLDSTGK